MATDYELICDDNRRAYGERGAIKIGQLTSQLLYADRTHFIYELLQNAEDALERRGQAWRGERGVAFILEADQLLIEHHGDPFTERDVKAICEFDESTKRENLTEIGSFGIGFKSVYAYTCEPRVFSGDERFAIRDYIYPHRIEHTQDEDSQSTVFVLPFKESALVAYNEIAEGLATLHRRTLLFLKNIEEINWRIESGTSGQYLRESWAIDEGVRRTILISQDQADDDVDEEEWLVFFRPVTNDGEPAGEVQVGFLLDNETQRVRVADDCTLFARFATRIETHTGFLMDGPYQTNLSRDDVPPRESWNRYLINETAGLLIESLRYLRDTERLNAAVLNCLPLDELGNLPSRSLLVPLFEKTSQALRSERLLLGSDGRYVSAQETLIPQTLDLGKLFSSEQLSQLYNRRLAWLDASITGDSRFLAYARNYLAIREVRPEEIIRRLDKPFLETQSDVWIQGLYRSLQPQRALRKELSAIPIVRLSDGSHVASEVDARSGIYLPTGESTSFRTVRRAVCEDETARAFLEWLGIRKWDRIDDLVENVLPTYTQSDPCPTSEKYTEDIGRIVEVWSSSSQSMKQQMEHRLKDASWIQTVDAQNWANIEFCQPRDVYLATEELIALYSGVEGSRMVDKSQACLVGVDIERLMKNCGAYDCLRPVPTSDPNRFNSGELSQMRRKAYPSLQSHEPWEYSLKDWQLDGLEALLRNICTTNTTDAREKSELLWSFLVDMERSYLKGLYEWHHYKSRRCSFDSQFLLMLRNTEWVPDTRGVLQQPSNIVFDSLGWRHDDDLIHELKFKSPVVEELANEAGLPVGMIQLLKSRVEDGMTLDELERSLERGRGRAITTRKHRDPEPAKQSFASSLLERQSIDLAAVASSSPVRLPSDGPRTRESASTDRSRALEADRQEGWQVREVSHRERGSEGRSLADEFRDMVEGDYGRRCQICGRTFAKANLKQQVFVVHLVPPAQNSSTNYFGNLIGLCGWHFALFQYGQRCLITGEDGVPVTGEEQLRALVLNLPQQFDDAANAYRGLHIRFWNVYRQWDSEASSIDEVIHYSNPHWQYFCELLRVDQMESS